MYRQLQHANIGLNDKGEEDGSDPSLLFPYVVSIFVCAGLAVLLFRFVHSYICRVCFGREPPFDPIVGELVLASLTDDQRKAVQHSILSKLSKPATEFDAFHFEEKQEGHKNVETKNTPKNSGTKKESSKAEAAVDSDPTITTASIVPCVQDVKSENKSLHDAEQGTKTMLDEDMVKEEGSNDDVSDDDDDNEHVCPICLSNFQKSDVLVESDKCRHIFHVDCISEWLSNDHVDCPVCRVQITTKDDMMRAAVALVRKGSNSGNGRNDWKRLWQR